MNYELVFRVTIPEGGVGIWSEEEALEHAMECCFYVLWGHQLLLDPMECTFKECDDASR